MKEVREKEEGIERATCCQKLRSLSDAEMKRAIGLIKASANIAHRRC